MAIPYAIVVVEKYKKGTTARVLGTYPSKEYAEKIRSEKIGLGKEEHLILCPLLKLKNL